MIRPVLLNCGHASMFMDGVIFLLRSKGIFDIVLLVILECFSLIISVRLPRSCDDCHLPINITSKRHCKRVAKFLFLLSARSLGFKFQLHRVTIFFQKIYNLACLCVCTCVCVGWGNRVCSCEVSVIRPV